MNESFSIEQNAELHPSFLWRNGPSTFPVKYGRSVISRILPHRSPMLLLDSITHVDIQEGALTAQSRIDPDDPIFAGHLPGRPIYPAVLLLEMVVQAAGCLNYFLSTRAPTVCAPPLPWLEEGIIVHGACFPLTVHAGEGVAILVKLLAATPGALTVAGHVKRDDDLCASTVIELGGGRASPMGTALPWKPLV